MKVLIVGGGGREHALAWKLAQSPRIGELMCAPGNGGTAGIGENLAVSDGDLEGLLDLAQTRSVDLTMVGPEAPLADGIVDLFRRNGLKIVGPTAAAARLESSKAFAKDFMDRHSIPTARYRLFDQAEAAESALKQGDFDFPIVLKADGLAAGKGVLICTDLSDALRGVRDIMRERRFGVAGRRLVIEEFLQGHETSYMVFSDGSEIVPMVPSQDHKRALDGDRGLNTGGMGAYSIDALLDDATRREILDGVMRPTIDGMAAEGAPFQGILYAGLMMTSAGPRVLEFNVRFGDPETQVVLPRLRSDLLDVLDAMAQGDLSGTDVMWDSGASACVVLAAPGYPEAYEKGSKITGLSMAEEAANVTVFHAGTRRTESGECLTDGGRVLGVSSTAPSLPRAVLEAYQAVNKIHFEGMHYRRDIAARTLDAADRS